MAERGIFLHPIISKLDIMHVDLFLVVKDTKMVYKHFGLEQSMKKGIFWVWNRVSVSQKLARRSVIDTLEEG